MGKKRLNSPLDVLLDRIQTRQAVIGVLGLGYVGLPLALLFEESGFPVVGFDLDDDKLRCLAKGGSYIRHIGPERVAASFGRGRISATNDFGQLAKCDAILICVPTPLGRHREPDLSFLNRTTEEIAARLQQGQLIVLESTSYPGTTREELLPRLSASGLVAGADFFLGFSPEREDPGNEMFTTKNIPKIVAGIDLPSRQAVDALYSAVVDRTVPVSSPEIAESAKLLENTFRAVNIALVNEMKMVLERMRIDIWEVIEAAKTKPFGFMPFYPGPGLGGHCIPLDPFYLAWKAAEHGVWARFVELAGEINSSMPRYVVTKTVEELNRQGRSLKGSRLLVLGLSYKPDIDDDRESPSFEIIKLLQEGGALVDYCDPFIPAARRGRKYDLRLESIACSASAFSRYDALILSTPHTAFKDLSLYEGVKIVVDTRNVVPASAVPQGIVCKA